MDSVSYHLYDSPQSRGRWTRMPLSWVYAVSALIRSIALAAGTVAATTTFDGVLVYLSIAILCVVVFVLPAYLKARRTAALVNLSLTDPLTGIGNRRALQTRLEQEIARCSRGGYSVALLMIDVDRLKETNDQAGHRAGDEVLRTVARALTRSTRISDLVGRFGGDEFLVIAPQTTKDAAGALAERIAADARRMPMTHLGAQRASLSIGVSTASSMTADMQLLLEMADRAMYEAKKRGGDRVVVTGQCSPKVSGPPSLENVLPLRPVSGR